MSTLVSRCQSKDVLVGGYRDQKKAYFSITLQVNGGTVHYENGLIKAIMSATMNQVALITQEPRNNISIVNYDIMILGLALKDRVLV